MKTLLCFALVLWSVTYAQLPIPVIEDRNAANFNAEVISNDLAYSDTVLTVIGRWPRGLCDALVAKGDFVYIGNGQTLQIVDASAVSPFEIVSDYVMDWPITAMATQDTFLFIGSGAELILLSIADPVNPIELGKVDLWGSSIQITSYEDHVFASVSSTIFSINISDPLNPLISSSIPVNGQLSRCLAVKDGFIYAGNFVFPNLAIFDATAPDTIEFFGEITTNSRVQSAFVKDTLLYIGNTSGERLQVYELTDPSSPNYLGGTGFTNPGRNPGVIIDGDHLYMTTDDFGVLSFNISDPLDIRNAGELAKPDDTYRTLNSIVYSNNRLYMSTLSGVWVVDATQSSNLLDLFSYSSSYAAIKVVWQNELAFLASGYSGLWILDFSNPMAPREISNIRTGGFAGDVLVDENLAFVTNYAIENNDTSRGIWFVDIADINEPVIINHFTGISDQSNIATEFNPLAKSGDLLFMSGNHWPISDSILQIIDVSDPLDPQSLGVFQGQHPLYSAAVSDSQLYLACANTGLKILSWRDPSNPIEIASFNTIAAGVIVNDPIACVLGGNAVLLDISDPFTPTFLGETPIAFGIASLSGVVEQNYLYWTRSGIGVVDISDPTAPSQITKIEDPFFISVSAKEDLLAATNSISGIWIFQNNRFPTSIQNSASNVEPTFELYSNYPNPFNSTTKIRFSVPKQGTVRIELFNTLGEKVSTIFNGNLDSGEQEVDFDSGSLPSGIYFYRLESEGHSAARKMVLMR